MVEEVAQQVAGVIAEPPSLTVEAIEGGAADV